MTVKRDRAAFDQQRHTHELKQLIGPGRHSSTTTSTANVKQEMKFEMLDDPAAQLATGTTTTTTAMLIGDDVLYDEDTGFSYSTTSSHHSTGVGLPTAQLDPDALLTANCIRNPPSVLLDQQQLLNVRTPAHEQLRQHQQTIAHAAEQVHILDWLRFE